MRPSPLFLLAALVAMAAWLGPSGPIRTVRADEPAQTQPGPTPWAATLDGTVRGWRPEMADGFGAWWLPPGESPGSWGPPSAGFQLAIELDPEAGTFVAPVPMPGPGATTGTLVIGVAGPFRRWRWFLTQSVILASGQTAPVTFDLDALPTITIRGSVWPADATFTLENQRRPMILPMGPPTVSYGLAPEGGLATVTRDAQTGTFTIRCPLTPVQRAQGVRVVAHADGHESTGVNVGPRSRTGIRLWLIPSWLFLLLWLVLLVSAFGSAILLPLMPAPPKVRVALGVMLVLCALSLPLLLWLAPPHPFAAFLLGAGCAAVFTFIAAVRFLLALLRAAMRALQAARRESTPFARPVTREP